ncbi:hypothetical protein E4U53_001175 [Claviceps sorghi]|nr:hypothetical protein E4U53_001175 [Claviceps sorghi]
MNAHALVARAALRPSRHALRRPLPAFACFLASAYHSYPLPAARGARDTDRKDMPESRTTTTPIAPPEEALPRVHETRPPEHRTPMPTAAPLVEPASTGQPAAAQRPVSARPRSKLRARKAAMRLTPAAVEQLRMMLDRPEPKLIKVGVRNRGCSGLAYHLEYVEKPGPFDEMVEQDGVRVLIDSKALFSIIGSEMDWAEDKLNQRFVFKNPNINADALYQRNSAGAASHSWYEPYMGARYRRVKKIFRKDKSGHQRLMGDGYTLMETGERD